MLLAAIYVAVFALLGSSVFSRDPDRIALGVTFDLTVSAAAVVWWFGVHRGALPGWIALAVCSWGVMMARAWVPHAPLSVLMAGGGGVEVVALGWLLLRIRRVVRVARAAHDEGPIDALEAGLVAAQVPRRIAGVMASELAVVWLATSGWFRRPPAAALSMLSTVWVATVGVIGFLVCTESIGVHIVLAMWSPVAAWVATASSAYLLVWLLGDLHAIRLHPVAVVGSVLHVRLGVRWRAKVPVDHIVSIDEVRAVPEGVVNLALMDPTVLVTLRAPVEVRGLVGTRRRGDRIALTIDAPARLIAAVRAATPASVAGSEPAR